LKQPFDILLGVYQIAVSLAGEVIPWVLKEATIANLDHPDEDTRVSKRWILIIRLGFAIIYLNKSSE
jgi:hypothetical protein